MSLLFLIRYELSHKPPDSLGLAYPGAVTRLLKLFILLSLSATFDSPLVFFGVRTGTSKKHSRYDCAFVAVI